MLPSLFKFGPIELHAYGLTLALSFLIGIQLAVSEGRRRGLGEHEIGNLALWIMGLSIAGARLSYVVTHLDSFQGRWLDSLKLWEGGLVLHGGLVAAMIGTVVLARRRALPVGAVFDSFAPSVALGEGITRIGCFLNGCCFGKACDLPWGVVFPADSHAGSLFPGQPIHPTQLYLAVIGFAGFGVLWALRTKLRGGGQLFSLFLLIEGVTRFTIDFVRYYSTEGESVLLFGARFGLTQLVAIGLVVIGVIGLARRAAADDS